MAQANQNILQKDNAAGRGVRTGLQAAIGFVSGLFVVVWAVPGVPEAIGDYVTKNLASFLAMIGIPSAMSGVVGFIWSKLRGVK